MTFLEWKRAKEKEEQEKRSASTTSTQKTASTTPSTGATTSKSNDVAGDSFLDWVRKNKTEQASDSIQNWYDSGRSLLNEVTQYYSDPKWGGGDSDYYSDFQNRASNLLASADSWRKQYAGNKEALSSVDSMVSALSVLKQSAMRTKDYYTQFESEDDYNIKYGYGQKYKGKTYDEIVAASAETTGSEAEWLKSYSENYGYADDNYYSAYTKSVDDRVAEIDSKIKAAKAEGRTTNSNFDQKGVSINTEYTKQSEIDALEEERTQLLAQKKRTEYNRAGHEHSAVADPNSSFYDPEFEKYAEIGKQHYEETRYDSEEAASTMPSWNFDQKGVAPPKEYSEWKDKLYSFEYANMEEDERNIYHYWLGKAKEEAGGGEIDESTAERYVELITEAINTRRGQKMAEDINAQGKLLQMAFSVYSGLESYGTNMKNAFSSEDEYIPATATAVASQGVREDMHEDGNLWGVAYDVANNYASNAPSLAMSFVPYVGTALFLGSTGLSSAGQAYADAINQGYSVSDARKYSTAIGVTEAGLSYLLDGLIKGGGKLTNAALGKLTSKVKSATTRAIFNYAGKMGSEFIEENLQEGLFEPVWSNVFLKTDKDVDLLSEEALYSGLLGALSAAGHNAVGSAVNAAVKQSDYKDAKTTYGDAESLQGLIAEGLENPTSKKLAEKVQARVDGNKKVSGKAIYNLVQANENAIHSEDIDTMKTAAAERLQTLGESGDVSAVADVIAKQASGESLTRSEQAVLKNSKYGTRVSNEMSPQNVGTGEYSNTWAESIGTNRINNGAYNYAENKALFNLAKETAGVNTQTAEETAEDVDIEAPKGKSIAEVKTPSVDNLSLSEDGVTRVSSTGTEITIDKNNAIAKVEKVNGEDVAYYNTDQGVVAANDITYSNESEGIIFEGFTDMIPAIGNPAIKAYDGTTPAMTYVKGMREGILTYGRYNFKGVGVDISADSHLAELSKADQDLALGLGRQLAEIETNRVDKALKSAIRNAANNVKKTSKGKPAVKGGVTFERGVEATTERQKAAVTFAEKLAEVTGIRIVFYDSKLLDEGHKLKGVDGAATSDTILLDMSNSHDDAIAYTLSHEFVHFAKKWSHKEFKVFSDFMVEQFAEHGKSMQELVEAKMSELNTKDWDEAFEEVVCDACERMLMDSNAMEKLAVLKKKDPNVFQKFMQHIKDLLDKLRAVMAGTEYTNEYSKELHDMEDVLSRFYELFENLAVDAVQNFQVAQEAGITYEQSLMGLEENTDILAVEDTVKHSYKSLANAAGFEAVENDDGTRAFVRNGKKVSKVTVDDIEISPIGALINFSLEKGDIDKENARKQKQMFADICTMACKTNDFSMTMQFVGSTVFTGMKANADAQYGTTYDFPSICTKTQAVIDAMSAKMVKLGRGLNSDEILHIYNEVFTSGNPVPCPECYVFSRWIGIGGLLDNIKSYQDYYGKMKPTEVAAIYEEMKLEVKSFADEMGITYGKAKGALTSKLTKEFNKLTEKIEKNENQGEKVSEKDRKRLAEIEPKMKTVKAMTWIEKVYFEGSSLTKVRKNFAVPNEILFDLNRGEEFATQYPEAWAFRTTQGAGYGKAITPYADAVLGEGIHATQNLSNTIKGKANGNLNNLFLQQRGTLDSKAKKVLEGARIKQKVQAFLGGQRFQSTSDARYENASDYLIAALEMQAMQGMVQVYTKVDGAVPAFSTWGFSINQSLMPLGGGIDAKGNLKDTSVGGMKPDVAFKNRENHESAGTITIGVNDRHIRALIAKVERDFVIPYHASGGKANLIAEFRRVQDKQASKGTFVRSSDYSKTQSDKVLSDTVLEWMGKSEEEIEQIHKVREARIAILTRGKPNMEVVRENRFLSALYDKLNGGEWDGVKIAKGKIEHQIFPNEFWDQSVVYEDSKKITEDYLEYCEDLGFLHRFSGLTPSNGMLVPVNGYDENGNRVQLTDLAYKYDKNGKKTAVVEDFFWKVITDRRMYDNDGNYLPQKRVVLNDTTTNTVTSFAKNNAGREYNKELSLETASKIANQGINIPQIDLGTDLKFSKKKSVVDVNGNEYDNVVELNYKTFNKVRRSGKAYIDFIRKNLIKETITVYNDDGLSEVVQFAGENERIKKDGSKNPRRVLGELEQARDSLKKVVILNAVETAEISRFAEHSDEHSHQWLDQNGWDRRVSYVMSNDGMIYPVTLHIAKTKDGRNILYDVNVHKNKGIAIDKNATSLREKTLKEQAVEIAMPSDDGIVSQPLDGVKKQKKRDSDYVQEGTKAVMTTERINYLIDDSGAGRRVDYANYWITSISPTDFINMTTSLNVQDREAFDKFPSEWNENSTMDTYDYMGELKRNMRQTPYLAIDIDTGEVVGHEGRHRIRALEREGIKSVEIRVEFRDEDGRTVKYSPNWERLQIKDSVKLINQFGTGQTASITNVIPLNENYRSEILANYGESHADDGDIRYQKKKVVPIEGHEYQKLVNTFGTTKNYDVAGYLLGNGLMLDFSGKHWGDDYSTSRQVDHRDVLEGFGLDSVHAGNNGVDAMIDMIGNGNIRLMPEVGGINLAKAPNQTQTSVLRGYINHFRGEIVVDIDEVGGDTIHSFTYNRGTSSSKILLDIKNYFDNGVVPEQNANGTNIREFLSKKTETSARHLLSNALESVAQNDIERNKLDQYKKKIDLLNEEEAKLRELKEELRKLSFPEKGTKRDQKRINDLRFEANHTESRINTLDKMLLDLEASAPLKKVLQREKDAIMKVHKKRGREMARAAVREKTESISKKLAKKDLEKLVLDTTRWLTNPKKDEVKCPDILRVPFAEFLNSIDMSSKRMLRGGNATKNDLRFIAAMDELSIVVKRIQKAQDPSEQDSAPEFTAGYLDLPANFMENIDLMSQSIKRLMVMSDTGYDILQEMSSEEMKTLIHVIKTLKKAIREMQRLYTNYRFANAVTLGQNTMEFVDQLGADSGKIPGIKDFYVWQNTVPYYAFKRFGEAGESIFESFMDAQDKQAFLADEILKFSEDTWTTKEVKEWSNDVHDIMLPSGATLTLTTADAMNLYCLARRQHAGGHLAGYGVRVKGIKKSGKKLADSIAVFTEEDVDEILKSKGKVLKLNDRQVEVAEAMQKFMSTTCAEWGNEISMKRFLTKMFNEELYVPIQSDPLGMDTKDPEAQKSDLFRLLNISATKPLTEGANNRIIVRNLFDVFTEHSNDMARLNAWGMALLDYMKWMNYREKTVDPTGKNAQVGVRQSIETAYSESATNYLLNFIKDVNGVGDGGRGVGWVEKMFSHGKTASVGANLRVAALQLTAYPRAALVLSPKSLAIGAAKLKPSIAKAKKYCGIALWKSFGYYDTDVSRSMEAQIKGDTTVMDRIKDASMWLAGKADEVTWGYLWNACEAEVAATGEYEKGTEEFNIAVGKKLREVVYSSQVVDSVLTRSQLMRSKNSFAKMASSFMSEPTMTHNITLDCMMKYNIEKRKTGSKKAALAKTWKHTARSISTVMSTTLLVALVGGLWSALRDDDDEPFDEKFTDAAIGSLLEELIPLSRLPLASDITSLIASKFGIGYFASSNMTTDYLHTISNAYDAWVDIINNGEDAQKTVYYALFNTVKGLSQFTGVPASNAMRDVVSLWNSTVGDADYTMKIRTYEPSDSANAKNLYQAIVSGDTKWQGKLEALWVDETERQKDLKKVIGDHYAAGDIDFDTASNYLEEYCGMDDEDIHWQMDRWQYTAETGSSDGYSKYDDFITAVETGKNLKAVIQEYTTNGVEKKTLASQITSHFKPLYKEMSKSERARLKGYLLNAYSVLGYDRSKKSKDIDKWLED